MENPAGSQHLVNPTDPAILLSDPTRVHLYGHVTRWLESQGQSVVQGLGGGGEQEFWSVVHENNEEIVHTVQWFVRMNGVDCSIGSQVLQHPNVQCRLTAEENDMNLNIATMFQLGDNTFVIEWFAGINCIILWSQI